jgi:hypothetical protein
VKRISKREDPRGRLDLALLRLAEAITKRYVEPRIVSIPILQTVLTEAGLDLSAGDLQRAARQLVQRHVIRKYRIPRKSILPARRITPCT